MSVPTPPQGGYHPYGQGNQNHNPYPPAYGQHGPYGPPQAPNPGPYPYPYQPPFPHQPLPQPPKKSRTGLIVSLSLVGVAVLFGVGRAVTAMNQGAGPESSYPAAKYRLTLPKTLLDGSYTLADDISSAAPQNDDTFSKRTMKDWTGIAGRYTGQGGAQAGEVLSISAQYGRIRLPDEARKSMLRGAEDGQNATLVVPRKDITPAGSDLTVSCEVLTFDDGTGKATVPMCAWADDNTAGIVGEVTPEIAQQDPEAVDLEKAAARTLQVRKEMREPLN